MMDKIAMKMLNKHRILTVKRVFATFLLTGLFCVQIFAQNPANENERTGIDNECELKVAVLDYQDALIAGATVRFTKEGRSTETSITAQQSFERVRLLPGEYEVYVSSRFNSLIFGRSKFTLACPAANQLNLYPLFKPVSQGDNRPTPTCETVNGSPATPSPIVMCCEMRIRDGEYEFCHRPVVTMGGVTIRAAYALLPQKRLEFRFLGEVRFEDSIGPPRKFCELTLHYSADGLKEIESKE